MISRLSDKFRSVPLSFSICPALAAWRPQNVDREAAGTAPLHPAKAGSERYLALVRGDEGGARAQIEIGHTPADKRLGRKGFPPPPAQPCPRVGGTQVPREIGRASCRERVCQYV